jgi:hypothetical protein
VHTFKDTTGREWQININVNTLKRIRDQVEGFDLLKVVEDKNTIARLTDDPFILVAVTYAACQPQAEAAGVNPELFGEAMGSGDVLEAAATALLEDLADFFPPHRRGAMKAAIAKLREIQAKAAQMATAKIESPAMMQAVIAVLQSQFEAPTFGPSSTNPPASSASTPAPSLSAN